MGNKQIQIEAPRLSELENSAPEIFRSRGDYLHLTIAARNYAGGTAERHEIVGCHLLDSNLSATKWDNVHISDTIFENCDLAGARWDDPDFHRVEFRGCRLTGFLALQARFTHVVFRDCQMGLAQMRGLKSKHIKLENCVLLESDWSGSDLTGAIFHGCDLSEADFYQAKLHKADLRGSTIETIRLSDDAGQNVAFLRGLKLEPMQAALLCAHFGLKVCWSQENG